MLRFCWPPAPLIAVVLGLGGLLALHVFEKRSEAMLQDHLIDMVRGLKQEVDLELPSIRAAMAEMLNNPLLVNYLTPVA